MSAIGVREEKLYDEIEERFKSNNAALKQIHRRYFSEERGMQLIMHLCAPEFKNVELQLRHKHYGLAGKYWQFFVHYDFLHVPFFFLQPQVAF